MPIFKSVLPKTTSTNDISKKTFKSVLPKKTSTNDISEKRFTQDEYDNATYFSQITAWNLILETLLKTYNVDMSDKSIRLTELLINLWNTIGIENGQLTCNFDGNDLNLLDDFDGKIPTFIDNYGNQKTLYRYNFVGMVINTNFRKQFQYIWQQWSIDEINNGFPQNLIPLILPIKINKQIQKGHFKIVLTYDNTYN